MNQSRALAIMLSGESVFLTGPAGTGKTYVLREFIRLYGGSGKHVAVTATTGIAATHLGGSTIHSWSGIGINDILPRGFYEHMSKTRIDIIAKTDVLIIDEISMLHDYRLDMIEEIARIVKKVDKPFGGLQLIMSGDFFQLPPVNRTGDLVQGGFAFTSEAWRQLDPVICYLEDQYRQNDDKLAEILMAMRAGEVRRHHAESLLERTGYEPDEIVTELHTTNVDVDRINEQMLTQLDGDEVSYSQISTGGESYVDTLEKSVLAPKILKLKIGAFVMAVKNSLNKKFANGSLGEVVAFEPYTDYPVVKFRNGNKTAMQPDTWELRDGEKKRASITQIPLRLAWAITVHKSQGMTLDSAKIDLRKAFVEGMGYVALSRVRNLDSLYLLGINQKALMVSEIAKNIDEDLRKKSANDSKRFEHLGEVKEKDFIKEKKKIGQDWKEKLEAMRKDHPNAYKPWTAQQDEDLKLMFIAGKSPSAISKKLGRHEGSIMMRLQKHFGEDAIQ